MIFGAIFTLVVLLSWIGFLLFKAQQPKPIAEPPKPTYLFGQIPYPVFPESEHSAANKTFTLDTETGNLPTDLPTLAKVYAVPPQGSSFAAPDRIKAQAKKFGFTNEPEILDPTHYRFTDELGGVLNIDLSTNNFTFERPYTENNDTNSIIEDKQTLVSVFKSYLSSKGLLKPEISQGRAEAIYNQNSQRETTRATITIWPANLDNLEIVTPQYNLGLIVGEAIKSGDNEKRFIRLNYTYWEPDLISSANATYSLIPPTEAFTLLRENKGVIVISPPTGNISITNVKLAYYQTQEYQIYIQPVYVFEGPNFAAYVPALTSEYLQPN